MRKYITITLITVLLFCQSYFFGQNDYVAIGFIILTATLFYHTLIKIQIKSRQAFSNGTAQDGWAYNFLSVEPSFSIKVLVFTSSLILSIILMTLVKGIALKQGYTPFIFFVVISSIFLYSLMNKAFSSSLNSNNIHVDIVVIFISAMLLNVILSLVFSANDTFEFKTKNISFENFAKITLDEAVNETDHNHYGRIIINSYLLMDNIKSAFAKEIVSEFNLEKGFYGFYVVIFILNLFKMLAFSYAFVLLQKSFFEIGAAIESIMKPKRKNDLSKLLTN